MTIVKTHKVRLVTNNVPGDVAGTPPGICPLTPITMPWLIFKAGLDAGEWRREKALRPRFNSVKGTLAPWASLLSQNASKYAIIELGQAIDAFAAYRKAVKNGKERSQSRLPQIRRRDVRLRFQGGQRARDSDRPGPEHPSPQDWHYPPARGPPV